MIVLLAFAHDLFGINGHGTVSLWQVYAVMTCRGSFPRTATAVVVTWFQCETRWSRSLAMHDRWRSLWECKLKLFAAKCRQKISDPHPEIKIAINLLNSREKLKQVEEIWWKKSRRQFNLLKHAASTLRQRNFVAWQCLRWVVIRATTLFNYL